MTFWNGTVVSGLYSQARPLASEGLIQLVLDYAGCSGSKKLGSMLDIGCGPGNTTVKFASSFDKIVAIDVSKTQIDQANQDFSHFDNIKFQVGDAYSDPETLDLFSLNDIEEASVDLVTCFLAAHWFNTERFLEGLRRVLKAGAAVAFLSYSKDTEIKCIDKPELNSALERVKSTDFLQFFNIIEKAGFFAAELQLVWDRYENLRMPYDCDLQVVTDDPTIYYTKQCYVDDLITYLRTWSGYNRYLETHPNTTIMDDLRQAYVRALGGDDTLKLEVTWKWHAKMCRKQNNMTL